MNPPCAKCNKTVYPIEKINCLDKIWHKTCFKCEACNMTLNMKNYKGYNKLPYCNAHYPTTKHTVVADTPENRRIASNTKNQSAVSYHADFEKQKGSKTSVVDDPETARIKKNTNIQSNVAYWGVREQRNAMESKRPNEAVDEVSSRRKPGKISDYDPAGESNNAAPSPYAQRNSANVVYDSQKGGAGAQMHGHRSQPGSIADYDPMTDRHSSASSNSQQQQQRHQQQAPASSYQHQAPAPQAAPPQQPAYQPPPPQQQQYQPPPPQQQISDKQQEKEEEGVTSFGYVARDTIVEEEDSTTTTTTNDDMSAARDNSSIQDVTVDRVSPSTCNTGIPENQQQLQIDNDNDGEIKTPAEHFDDVVEEKLYDEDLSIQKGVEQEKDFTTSTITTTPLPIEEENLTTQNQNENLNQNESYNYGYSNTTTTTTSTTINDEPTTTTTSTSIEDNFGMGIGRRNANDTDTNTRNDSILTTSPTVMSTYTTEFDPQPSFLRLPRDFMITTSTSTTPAPYKTSTPAPYETPYKTPIDGNTSYETRYETDIDAIPPPLPSTQPPQTQALIVANEEVEEFEQVVYDNPSSSSTMTTTTYYDEEVPPPQQPQAQQVRYVALYDYVAADDDEVSFQEGDMIGDCEIIDEGWMTGRVLRSGQHGMLPSNYVERA